MISEAPQATNLLGDLTRFQSYAPHIDLTFNQYLLAGAHPVLVHAGDARHARQIAEPLAAAPKGQALSYIFISQFESDECGGLPFWLDKYPAAIPVCSEVTARQLNGFELTQRDDIPYIQGEKPLLKMDPSRVEAMIQALPPAQRERARELFLHPPTARVTRVLADGERLPERGGMVVIHTPGHTPGHVSLFLEADRLLVSGDALRVVDGELVGPLPSATPDMARAMESVRKLLDFPIDRVLCFHGDLSKPGALERIREIGSAG